MIVVSDTSTITNLHQVQELKLLHLLYDTVLIPPAVVAELNADYGQQVAIERLDWIIISEPTNVDLVAQLRDDLDYGESQAIALAIELNADYLIIDERHGRATARGYGISIIGLLGVLIAAKRAKHIAMVKPIIERVVANGFRLNSSLLAEVLEELGEI